MKPKTILILSNRALDYSHGARNLIEERALALWREYRIKTIVISITREKNIKNNIYNTKYDGVEFENFGYKNTPLSIISTLYKARKRAIDVLKNENVISVGWSGWWIYVLRLPFKGPSFIDIHGTQKEIVDFSNPSISIKLQYLIRVMLEMFGASRSKAGLFVTDELAQSRTSFKKITPFIIPCGIKDYEIDEVKLLRKKWRERFQFNDNDIVFVYSGSNSKWQCLNEAVALWKRIKDVSKDNNLSIKLLVLKAGDWKLSDYDQSLELYKDHIIETSLNPSEAKEALTAGDFGLILRKDIPTNNVAFPNKFGEYINANLIPILTPAIKDPYKYLKKNDISYVDIPQSEVDEIFYTEETVSNIIQIASTRSKNYMFNLKKTRKVTGALRMDNLINDFANWINDDKKGIKEKKVLSS